MYYLFITILLMSVLISALHTRLTNGSADFRGRTPPFSPRAQVPGAPTTSTGSKSPQHCSTLTRDRIPMRAFNHWFPPKCAPGSRQFQWEPFHRQRFQLVVTAMVM